MADTKLKQPAPGKHVSNIPIGGMSKNSDSHKGSSVFGDDDRHFDVSLVDDESPSSNTLDDGVIVESEELSPKFGTATLSKSAPVTEKIKEQLSERQSSVIDDMSNGNGHMEKDSAPSSESTISDERSSQTSQEIADSFSPPASWAVFAQSLFQVRGSHSYCCAALQQPLLPKKDKADHIASLASWILILRVMGDLPDIDHAENINVAGTSPPIFSAIKQNFQKKLSKKDVDDAHKKISELFKDPTNADVKSLPFMPDSSGSMLEKVQYICALGIFRPDIRDELYCQVCKQLTNNPSRNSTVRGWVLLHLFAGSFSPTERFSSCFLQFLKESPPVYASRVEKLLRRTFIAGTRSSPPSWLEFQAAKNGKPILLPVAMMNGHRMLVDADSATTVQELCRQIYHRMGLKDASGFSIYITLMQRISCLGHGMHRIMDAVAECEQHTKQMGMRESSSTWRLYFRKEYFVPWYDPEEDVIATDLIYQQVMRGVSVGEYRCEKDDVVALLAAQRYFCENPGNMDNSKIQTFLTNWLPSENKKEKEMSFWVEKVTQTLKNDLPKKSSEVDSLKRDIVVFAKNKWYPLFSRFYDAGKIQGPSVSWQTVILGLNSKGLHVMDEAENIKLQITFLEITSVTRGRRTVTINTLKKEEYVISSNHSEDLYFLLTVFLDGLKGKSKYGLVIQDSTQIEGAIGVSVAKGDLVVLDKTFEHYVDEDVFNATCKRTGKLNTMPCDLVYILPTSEEPQADVMGMLALQLRKDVSTFPVKPVDIEEHNLQAYAKLHFRMSNDNAVTSFLKKASFKSSKKDKSTSLWQFQKEAIKKPLLNRTLIREELKGASCRSFLAIQQYMRDTANKDQLPDTQLANEYVIEPAMRSRHMREEIYCQIIKQLTNNPDKLSEEYGWRLFFLLCSCTVPTTELSEECEAFMKSSKHQYAKLCLKRFKQTKSDGARQYPPHVLEHDALAKKRFTVIINIAFPFQLQEDFEVEPSSRVFELKRKITDKYELPFPEEYGLCFALRDRGSTLNKRPKKFGVKYILVSAYDNEYFLDALTNVEQFWLRACTSPTQRSSVSEQPSSSSQDVPPMTIHTFFLKKLWINIQPGVNKNADSMFHFPQEIPNYLRGYHNCSEKDAGKLAAYLYRAQFGDNMSAMTSFQDNIKSLIPQQLIQARSEEDWKKIVTENLKTIKGLTSDEAKCSFLKVLHLWPTYGSVFFHVKQRSMKNYPKHILFAVNTNGIMLLDPDSKNVLAKYGYSKIPNWTFDEQSFTLVIGEGSSASKFTMETNLGHNMDDIIMSYVAWMMNTHIRKRPSYSGVTVGESMC